MRLGHIVINVDDYESMVDFYLTTVGLEISDLGTGGGRPNAPRIAFLSSDRHRMHHELALAEFGHAADAPGVLNHLAFEVDDLERLRAVWKRVVDDPRAGGLGGGKPATAFQGDQWGIRFSDPERNGVEVYAPTPWDVRAAASPYTYRTDTIFEPFDLAAADDELVAWGVQHMDEMGLEYWPRGQRPLSPG